ncbi:MAG: carbon starvation CstA family protein [Verrucomicrobiota bacterium]
MKKVFTPVLWFFVAALGAWAYAVLSFHRGEHLNSIYILTAALCTYAVGYRFYSKWIATQVLVLNDRRATPSEVHDDGKDFVKTNKWIVFGHHFAAISGPGPLVGPVLAAQFGYLPSTLWILIGVVLGGAVQDFVILFCSMRRNGKSLGQMVKEELNNPAGYVAMLAILAIMVILLAVLALVVVNALAASPWGVFTVAATVPIAMFMGGYLRFWRVGKVMEASAIGVGLLLLAVWGGKFFQEDLALGKFLTLSPITLAWSIILYGLAASVLPVWLLLAPRDYLSTFMKLGTIFALAVGIFLVLPQLQMPAVSKFIDGSGLVVAGKLFPFCFITIACGSISGFHTLIASGTTPKIITRESYARSIGYGAMCLESLVAIMALIAACTLEPGVYFSMNVKDPPAETVAKVSALGYPITVEKMQTMADAIGENTLFGRAGGASTLAVGMAQIFSNVFSGKGLKLWYHFAIMFEALFILTTIDAGTRVGRYLLQDMLGHLWKPLGDTRNPIANLGASILLVGAWGCFLIQGVKDPLGGINSLWPLFGIANQLLAAIALCLATTVILKMQLGKESKIQSPTPRAGRPAFALITLIPLSVLLAVTMTAGVQKIFSADPRIGFLSAAKIAKSKIEESRSLPVANPSLNVSKEFNLEMKKSRNELAKNRALYFNNLLDTFVTVLFLAMVILIVLLSVREWVLLLARKKLARVNESEPVWLPEYAIAEARPLHVLSILALALALAKELSGEAAVDRARVVENDCGLENCSSIDPEKNLEKVYVQETERRFSGGINRCC